MSKRQLNYRAAASAFANFLGGQALTQLLALLTGLLLLRWLRVDEYAAFTVAFGYQSISGLLIDLGVTQSVVALAGANRTDADILGSYVRAAQTLRTRLAIVAVPLVPSLFLLTTPSFHTSNGHKLILAGTVVMALFAQRNAIYAAPLLLNKKIVDTYRANLVGAASRLVAAFALHLCGALTSITASALGVLSLGTTGWLLRRAAVHQGLVNIPRYANRDIERRVRYYLRPVVPGVIYYAFQGQIVVILAATFTNNHALAQSGAVGRLGQLVGVAGAANTVLLEPAFVRASAHVLPRYVGYVIVGGISVVTLTFTVATVWPSLTSLVLGAKYGDTSSLATLVLLNASLTLVAGTLYTFCNARRFIYWWQTIASIGIGIAAELALLTVLDLSRLRNLFLLSTAAVGTDILVHLGAMFFGIARGPRSERPRKAADPQARV